MCAESLKMYCAIDKLLLLQWELSLNMNNEIASPKEERTRMIAME